VSSYQNMFTTICFNLFNLFLLYLGYLGVKLVFSLLFASVLFWIFASSIFHMNSSCYSWYHYCSFVLLLFNILLIHESFYIYLIVLQEPLTLVRWFLVAKESHCKKVSRKVKGVVRTIKWKTLNCVKHKSCRDIFSCY
jgi:hypothetical protein